MAIDPDTRTVVDQVLRSTKEAALRNRLQAVINKHTSDIDLNAPDANERMAQANEAAAAEIESMYPHEQSASPAIPPSPTMDAPQA